jgi:Uncharacterized conserved protein related to C-terminal domain of eukaryotic chaperone, SACSIN
MKNDQAAKAHLADAEIILEEAGDSLKKGHYHRVIRKCQESTELAVKGIFRYLGLEYPKSHILGRVIKKELSLSGLFPREELKRLANISDSLAFDREPAFYGSPDGIPASELFDQEDAEEAIADTRWVINMIKKVIK